MSKQSEIDRLGVSQNDIVTAPGAAQQSSLIERIDKRQYRIVDGGFLVVNEGHRRSVWRIYDDRQNRVHQLDGKLDFGSLYEIEYRLRQGHKPELPPEGESRF